MIQWQKRSEKGRGSMVYGVFSGEYSDWEAHGYFEKEEDAIAYCDMKNGGDYREYYVLKLLNLKDGDPEVYRCYSYNQKLDYVDQLDWGEYLSTEKHETTVTTAGYCYFYFAHVWLKPRDFTEDKVRKIGQDAIAKYKAEKEGIV
jgi:hypothetical protein